MPRRERETDQFSPHDSLLALLGDYAIGHLISYCHNIAGGGLLNGLAHKVM